MDIGEVRGALVNLFYPNSCVVCGEIIGHGCVCPGCRGKVESEIVSCGTSGEGIMYVVPYNSNEVKRLVLAMKDENNSRLFGYVAGLCAENLRTRLSDSGKYRVTYLPRRLSNRLAAGLDQSHVLAGHIARQLSLPFEATLNRRLFTLEQKKLSGEQRRANVAGIFSAKRELTGESFILIDDITTTGSSLLSAQGALYKAGAAEVVPFAFARR